MMEKKGGETERGKGNSEGKRVANGKRQGNSEGKGIENGKREGEQ